MTGTGKAKGNWRSILGKVLSLSMLLCVMLGTFLMPRLFEGASGLTPVRFLVAEKSVMEDAVVLKGTFAQGVTAGETLWLYTEHAAVVFSVGGRRYAFERPSSTPAVFRSPGTQWHSLRTPGISPGEPAVLTIQSYYGQSEDAAQILLGRLYLGDGFGLYRLMLQEIDFFGMVVLCAFVCGILYILEGTINVLQGMAAEGFRIAACGFYAFAGGIWCAGDILYPYLSLVIGSPYIAALIDSAGLLLFPISLSALMRCYLNHKKTRRAMECVLAINILLSVGCLVSQFAGLGDLYEQQRLIGIVALCALGIAAGCVIVELKHKKSAYLVLLFLALLPVLVTAGVEAINLFWPFIERRTLMRYSFSLSILLLILQLFVYAREERAREERINRMEQDLAQSRIAIMLSQIQPHFLYNALVGIKELCLAEPSLAADALDHFAYFLRGNLDSLMHTQLICFEKEMSHVRDYLYLEQMRFPTKIRVEFILAEQDFRLPPLTIQPIVENAVRHGLVKKKGGGTVTIKSERTGDGVAVTIRDDGVGFDPLLPAADGRSHVGIQNVRERLRCQCGGALTIKSVPGSGTTAMIFLPQKEFL